MEANMDFSGIEYIAIRRIVERGTAEIIEQSEDVLFLSDTVSGVNMLACEDDDLARKVMEKHRERGIRLLTTTSKAAAEYAVEAFGFSGISECYQYAYIGEKPELDPRLSFRTADMSDFDTITAVYDLGGTEETAKTIERGMVLMAYDREGNLVGFIGEHMEGSLGMLYIFPEHRRRGYGRSLEMASFRWSLDRGFTPFGQVFTDNVPSLELQKDIGLAIADKLVYWTWKAE
jgi:GNAT superfamily N-acetyltransferase